MEQMTGPNFMSNELRCQPLLFPFVAHDLKPAEKKYNTKYNFDGRDALTFLRSVRLVPSCDEEPTPEAIPSLSPDLA